MRATPSSPTDAGSSVGSRRTTFSLGESWLSTTTRRPLIRVAIDALLEGFDADAVHHVDEALGFAVAALEVALEQLLDDRRDLRARERRADHLAEARAVPAGTGFTLIAADLDLIPLFAVLIDAED